MRIDANIIILLGDIGKQYKDMKFDEIARADIILGVFHPETTKEFTYIYKSRYTSAGYSTQLRWAQVLEDILVATNHHLLKDAELAKLPTFDAAKAVKDEDYRNSIIDWLKRIP